MSITYSNHKKYADEFDEINKQAKQILRTKKMYEDAFKVETEKQRELNQKCNTFKEKIDKTEDALNKADGDLTVTIAQKRNNQFNLRIVLTIYKNVFSPYSTRKSRLSIRKKSYDNCKLYCKLMSTIWQSIKVE